MGIMLTQYNSYFLQSSVRYIASAVVLTVVVMQSPVLDLKYYNQMLFFGTLSFCQSDIFMIPTKSDWRERSSDESAQAWRLNCLHTQVH